MQYLVSSRTDEIPEKQDEVSERHLTEVDCPFEDADFCLAGDNVNIAQKRRKTTKTSKNRQFNLFSCIAVKNRVSYTKDKIEGKVNSTVVPEDVPLSCFFMNKKNEKLRGEFRYLIAWTLVDLRPELSWMKKYLTKHIKHSLML